MITDNSLTEGKTPRKNDESEAKELITPRKKKIRKITEKKIRIKKKDKLELIKRVE